MRMPERVLVNWGSYDVDNFGDLLFPYIIEYYFHQRYDRIIHVSPTGKNSLWPDARKTITLAETLEQGCPSALIVGGGNLISWTKSSSLNYRENESLANVVHPSFFYAPMLLRARCGIPYALNMVGVSKPIPFVGQAAIRCAMNLAEYIGVRDHESARRLVAAGVDRDITVGIDSALSVSKVFPRDQLLKRFFEEVCPRYGIPISGPKAVIHLKERYIGDDMPAINSISAWLREQGFHAIFLPLGMCHEDHSIFERSDFRPNGATVLRSPKYLQDLLAILAVADLYVGSSLHGAISSLSYGNRALIVANEDKTRFSKFSGFLEQVGLTNSLAPSWEYARHVLGSLGIDGLKGVWDLRAYTAGIERRWTDISLSLDALTNRRNCACGGDDIALTISSMYKI